MRKTLHGLIGQTAAVQHHGQRVAEIGRAYSKQLCPITPDFVELKAKSMSATRAAGLASDLGNAN